jgi:L-seryl-tRNA(Ser) seleniumtransferase
VFLLDYFKSVLNLFIQLIDVIQMKEIYNPFKKYGIRRVLNASTCMTMLGGSIAPNEVFSAMEDASKAFVYIPELQQWAGRILARSTGAEAGHPTAGAGNAIMLAAAACIMRGTELECYDPLQNETWTHLIQKLPLHTMGLKTDFIVQKSNRNVYDHHVECAGGNFIEVGTEKGTTEEDLINAYDPNKTAAYYFTVRRSYKSLPLKTVIKVAHRNDVPVIVDAASELPPKSTLTKYIREGADLVIISGGKFIAGPNNSGILVGKKELIKLAHLQSYPFHGVGRAAKMSRETIVGLITALKIYLDLDLAPLFESWMIKAKWMVEQLNSITGVKAGLTYMATVEEKEPMAPLCYVMIDEGIIGIDGSEVSLRLSQGDPRIEAPYEPTYLLEDYEGKLTLNPEYMLGHDEKIVVDRLKEILNNARNL